jgi:hypothetical protein
MRRGFPDGGHGARGKVDWGTPGGWGDEEGSVWSSNG